MTRRSPRPRRRLCSSMVPEASEECAPCCSLVQRLPRSVALFGATDLLAGWMAFASRRPHSGIQALRLVTRATPTSPWAAKAVSMSLPPIPGFADEARTPAQAA